MSPLHTPLRPEGLDGILLIDKPAGPTSHDLVDAIRRQFRIEKVGHGGTLDPNATGLLILLLGRGTKLSNQMMGSDKTYEGIMRLGISTDTQDADGVIIAEHDAAPITREQVEAEMLKRIGDQMQTPPMVSAVKKAGVPLYKMARKGETVEREARLIHVYEFPMLDWNPPCAAFRLTCTKGTYVRTLCSDIGDALGCGAHLSTLRRTKAGFYDVEQAYALQALLGMTHEELAEKVIPLHAVKFRTP